MHLRPLDAAGMAQKPWARVSVNLRGSRERKQSRNMLNRVALLCLLAAASTSLTGRADAQQDLLEGAWQQIQSNAGACPKCRISLAKRGESLSVVANNGWSAVVGIEAS